MSGELQGLDDKDFMWLVEGWDRLHRNTEFRRRRTHPIVPKGPPGLFGFPDIDSMAVVTLPPDDMRDSTGRR